MVTNNLVGNFSNPGVSNRRDVCRRPGKRAARKEETKQSGGSAGYYQDMHVLVSRHASLNDPAGRKHTAEHAALARLRVDFQRGAMTLEDMLDDGQTKAGTPLLTATR